jgi:DNA-binding response OmpR family regulator
VEDDEGLAEVLCKDLASWHYLAEVAADGQTGLELADAFVDGHESIAIALRFCS